MNSKVIKLEPESYISLSTFRRDGKSVDTPVWFAVAEGKIYIFTDGTSYKVKRLRRNKSVRVAACNVVGRISGEWIDGRGKIVDDEGVVASAYAALQAKYGWQMTLANLGSRISGRIGRRAIIEVTL